ncbi:hypothetical protein SAY87_011426 [Trapa incisa]|uniref:Methylenetetrahydrofolate reductase n=1 Tax=Trapa incisa TaxID=236973 RepID=A0AAN7GN29_9MYRT|nr:hypothetical protein SAY87_011426 [Trapa incisa]
MNQTPQHTAPLQIPIPSLHAVSLSMLNQLLPIFKQRRRSQPKIAYSVSTELKLHLLIFLPLLIARFHSFSQLAAIRGEGGLLVFRQKGILGLPDLAQIMERRERIGASTAPAAPFKEANRETVHCGRALTDLRMADLKNRRSQLSHDKSGRAPLPASNFTLESFLLLVCLTASLLILPVVLPPLPPPPFLLLLLPIGIMGLLMVLAFMPSDVRDLTHSYQINEGRWNYWEHKDYFLAFSQQQQAAPSASAIANPRRPPRYTPCTGASSKLAIATLMSWDVKQVDAGADLIVTQLFYDTDIFLKFVNDCRQMGITCPVVPGIMPINNYKGFLRMTGFCKTKIPPEIMDALEPIKDNEEAVRNYGIHLGTEMYKKILANGIRTLHLYTLNMEKSALAILMSVGLIEETKISRSLPWRLPTNVYRVEESVRPIFWYIKFLGRDSFIKVQLIIIRLGTLKFIHLKNHGLGTVPS